MPRKTFKLLATVNSENLDGVRAPLERFLGPNAKIERRDDGFKIEAVIAGESAWDLDRQLLSEMRWVAKKTRLWAEWTSGGETETFFDYVPRGRRRPARARPARSCPLCSRRAAGAAPHSSVFGRMRDGSILAFQFQLAHFMLGTDRANLVANFVMASATLVPEYCIPTSATERP
jgi:hypothetical protein